MTRVKSLTRIDLVLRTTSPWHVAYPGNDKKSPDGGLAALTLTKKIGRQRTPYFTANGIRGSLRRHARDHLIPHLTTNNAISTDFFNGLSCGASKGQPDNSPNSVEELTRYPEHIYMGLFGGGARILPGSLQVSDINVICEDTMELHMVPNNKDMASSLEMMFPHVFGEEPIKPYQFLDKRHLTRVDDIMKGMSPDEISRIEGDKEAVAEHYSSVVENKKARAGGEKKSSLSNLIEIQVIPENTPMHFSVSLLPSATESQLGLLLMSLESLFRTNYIGGYGRVGFGQYRLEEMHLQSEVYDIEIRTSADQMYDDSNTFVLPSDYKDYIKEAEADLDAVNREEFESYFQNIKQKKSA